MTFKPSTDLPDYTKWTQEQLAVVAHNYHLQLLKMHNTLQDLRLELLKAKEISE